METGTNESDLAILVEKSFTRCCTAEARNTICTSDLTFKFVIVGEFLVCDMLDKAGGRREG